MHQKQDVKQRNIAYNFKELVTFMQFAGLYPICGIFKNNPTAIAFKWMSLPTFYTIFVLFCSLYTTLANVFFLNKDYKWVATGN